MTPQRAQKVLISHVNQTIVPGAIRTVQPLSAFSVNLFAIRAMIVHLVFLTVEAALAFTEFGQLMSFAFRPIFVRALKELRLLALLRITFTLLRIMMPHLSLEF
jgi:hypothetical protein